MSTDQLREWALHLASRDWAVFPLVPGTQRPAVRDWEQRATTDPDRITSCWHGRGFNIGLATGPSRLVVVDLDPAKTPAAPDGAAGLAALAAARQVTLPATWTVTTPRGGHHLYFTTPPGVRLRNTQSHLAPAIDTRAHGGYVVAPGSHRPDGAYELLDDTDPAQLPAWLVQALTERPAQALSAPPERACTDPGAYVRAAVAGECDKVRHAPAGRHNAVLCRAAYALGQLVGAGLLEHAVARAELVSAGRFLIGADCGCTATEVTRVVDAGLAAGVRNPRRGPGVAEVA